MTVRVDGALCVLCGLCTGVCPPNALDLTPSALVVRPHCNGCGLCVPYCPVGALSEATPKGRLTRRLSRAEAG